MAVNYTATKELTPMAIVISIGFVELLNWISGLIASPRVVLNALVYNPLVDKGSQWTVFISTLCYTSFGTWAFEALLPGFDFM